MRALRLIEFLSLDGVMQGPGSPDEDREGDFEHGGWQPPYMDESIATAAAAGIGSTDAYLFGRKTYEKLAAYWPSVSGDDPIARHLNSTQKYVVSRSLERAEWRNSTVLRGDAAAEVQALKARPGGNIAVLGSGELAQTLIARDLVDEFFLVVFPMLLGSGKRLFRQYEQSRKLRLVACRATGTGGVILSYRPAIAKVVR